MIQKPDYGLIYSKLTRHIAVASHALRSGQNDIVRDELKEAMDSIKQFETVSVLVKYTSDAELLLSTRSENV